MMRRSGGRRNKFPAFILAFAGALICMTHLSAEVLLIVLAILLIVIGIWLLFCC